MAEFLVVPHEGVSAKNGRPYVAFVMRLKDDSGQLFESEFLFPKWHRCDPSTGLRYADRPVIGGENHG